MKNRIPVHPPRPHSLRARLTLLCTAWFTLMAALACACFIVWSRRIAHDDVQERVTAAARLVAQEWQGDAAGKSAAKALSEAKEDMRLDNVALFILDRSGKVLGTNRTDTLSVAAMRRHGWLIAETHSLNAIIVAGMDWRATEAVLHEEALLLIAFGLLVSLSGGMMAWFLVGRTLRPIQELAEEANFASTDPLEARLRAPSDDAEVQYLVGTLNGFLKRFQENTRVQEQFYAAAAHELRTPLSILSGNIELALSRPRSATDYAETLLDLQQETQRLVALAEGLLILNRLQTSFDAEEPESIDLVEECERILATLEAQIVERQLNVVTDWEDAGIEFLAPRSHIILLLRNLIENAVKYPPTGGTLRLRVQSGEDSVSLSIYNDYRDAVNLPFDRIYEPFFRAVPPRSVTTDGNGLGLAICRRLADAHHWQLHHAPTEDGVLVNAVFPLAPLATDIRIQI